MAVQLTERRDGQVLEAQVSEKLTDADYRQFVPEFERLAKQHLTINDMKIHSISSSIRHDSRQPVARNGRRSVAAVLLAAWLLPMCGPAAQAAGPPPGKAITDDGIRIAVTEALQRARGVGAQAVEVAADRGVVALSGTVGNLLAKDRAVRIAEVTRGVRSVIDRMAIDTPARPDEDIRKDILTALMNDPATEHYQVGVKVKDAVATLSGTVGSWAESQLAAQLARGVVGAKAIQNNLQVKYSASRTASQILADVRSRLQWDVWVGGDPVTATAQDGKVTLTGSVGSALEKSRAVTDAWVTGVTDVDGKALEVDPEIGRKTERRLSTPVATDAAIRQAVLAAFRYDPRVAPGVPEVIVEDGSAILSGKVGNLKARLAAGADARNTAGVWRVDNLLIVQRRDLPSDAEASRVLKDALVRDPLLAGAQIESAVVDHSAYLSGWVSNSLQQAEAHDIASRVQGVVEIRNHLKVDPEDAVSYFDWPYLASDDYAPPRPKSDAEIARSIRKAFFWSPFVHRNDITVTVHGGVATLNGRVGSWVAYEEADTDARKGGATAVVNDLSVPKGVWF